MSRNNKQRRKRKCKLIVKNNKGPVELTFETENEWQDVTIVGNSAPVLLKFKKSKTTDIKEVLKNIMWSFIEQMSGSFIFWLITTTLHLIIY